MSIVTAQMPKVVEVLLIYTGGTIGSAPRDRDDPSSPQVVVECAEFIKKTPEFDKLPFGIEAVSMNPPLDSCNVRPEHWQWMAKEIEKHYPQIKGVVILHGTDTMVYTASALSFILRNLAKPVILTGAQRSAMVDVRNDAIQNIMTAMHLANPERFGLPVIPEVMICFGGLVLRGNRCFKEDTANYQAYESKNYPQLGEAGNIIAIDKRLILSQPDSKRVFHTKTRMEPKVATISIYPGVQDTDAVKSQLESPNLMAAIVLVYGSGDIPTDEKFLEPFRAARKRGVVLVALTQCPRGPVELGIYETSAKLIEVGFISGYDITLAAAQTKLMTLLGERADDEDDDDPNSRVEAVEAEFMKARAGEQSRSTYLTSMGGRKDTGVERLQIEAESQAVRKRLRAKQLVLEGDSTRIETAKLRLRGARLTEKERAREPVKSVFRVYLNLELDEEPAADDKRLVGQYIKWPSNDGVIMFDVTQAIREMGEAGRPISFTIFLETPGVVLEWERADLAVVVNELL